MSERGETYVPYWRRFPPIVYVMLALFIGVQAAMSLAPAETQNAVFDAFALHPNRFTMSGGFDHWYQAAVPLIAHAFLHVGWLHVGANCLGFVQVAPILASRLGQFRFFVLFLVSAIGGAFMYIALQTTTPMVGASGAICGLFAAFFLSNGRTPREALAAPGVRQAIVLFLGINVVLVGLSGLPIAWQAHLGGFIAGAIVYPLLAPRAPPAGPWG